MRETGKCEGKGEARLLLAFPETTEESPAALSMLGLLELLSHTGEGVDVLSGGQERLLSHLPAGVQVVKQPAGPYQAAVGAEPSGYQAVAQADAAVRLGWLLDSPQGVNPETLLRQLGQMDKIAVAGAWGAQEFAFQCPWLAERAAAVEAILPTRYLRARGETPDSQVNPDGPEVNLLTIGTGCGCAPAVCRGLVYRGCRVKWYLLCAGAEAMLARRQIAAYGVSGQMTVVEDAENPWAYLRRCHIYVGLWEEPSALLLLRIARIFARPMAAVLPRMTVGEPGCIPLCRAPEPASRVLAELVKNPQWQADLSLNSGRWDGRNARAGQALRLLLGQDAQKTAAQG